MLRRNFSIIAAALLASALSADAANFQVDSTTDSPNANPGDGKCVSKAGGCTLRAAIEEANASDVGNTVQIPSGNYTLSIPPEGENFAQSGSLFLTGEITISGQNFTDTVIDGGGIDRVFQVSRGSTIDLSDVTIKNGAARGGDGGGVLNRGTLSLTNVVFSGNKATADPGQGNGRGGALFNEKDATLMEVTIDDNQSDGRGGAIYNAQGANLNMMNGRITKNRSMTDNGGGVVNAGKMSLGMLPVRYNTAAASAGGIDNVEGELTLFDVGVANNTAGSNGGGLRNSGTAKLTNVTVGENEASGSGGGIDNRARGKLTLNNVTVGKNQAKQSGGGVQNHREGTVHATNTILSQNMAGTAKSECAGGLTSLSYNLVETVVGCGLSGEQLGDVHGKPAGLGDMAQNGGPSPNYALKPDSPAVDAGNPGKPTGSGGTCAGADQRGVKRPQTGRPGKEPRCDIGAFELK